MRRLVLRLAERTMRRREPDFVIGGYENPVTMRWWWGLPRNNWLNIYLHLWLQSDQDEALHDHMYDNVSWILEGAYIEEFERGAMDGRLCGDWTARRAATPHRVHILPGTFCVSLFITGWRYREWGFHCPQGWVHWQNSILGDGRRRGCGAAGSAVPDKTMVISAPTAHARPQTK